MQIGAVSFQPYVYKPNAISSNSLSKVNPIGNDLLASKTDFSGMTKETENQNPLKRGETANFADVLVMQMQMGRLNADKIMKPAQEVSEAVSRTAPQEISQADQSRQQNNASYQAQRAAMAYQMNMMA